MRLRQITFDRIVVCPRALTEPSLATRLIDTCCCNHGGRCTCSHNTESGLDTVHEIEQARNADSSEALPQRPRPPVRRRRANTVHSDGPLTFDKHGNYKPAQKQKIAQRSGPYQPRRVNSMRTEGSYGGYSSDQIMDAACIEPVNAASALAAHQQRLVKSEAASPLMKGTPGHRQHTGHLPPLDLSQIDFAPYIPNTSFDMFGASGYSEHDAPMFSAGLSAPSVDWSHIDVQDKNDGFASSSYGHTCGQSFNGAFDYGAGSGSEQAPTLAATTSTSGEVSEVEDSFIPGDVDYDALSGTRDPSFMRASQVFSSGTDLSSIDYDNFIKNPAPKLNEATPFDEPGTVHGGSVNFDNDPLFWGQQFNDDINAYNDTSDGMPMSTDSWNVQ